MELIICLLRVAFATTSITGVINISYALYFGAHGKKGKIFLILALPLAPFLYFSFINFMTFYKVPQVIAEFIVAVFMLHLTEKLCSNYFCWHYYDE